MALMQLGGIVGAGTFALPAAFKSTGILAGSAAFWAMALAILCLHLLYAEIVLARPDLMHARLPGQAGAIFGPWAKRFAFIIYPAMLIGASLVYIILGGGFLSVLASNMGLTASVITWQTVFWLGGVVTIAFGLAIVSRVESWLARGLISLILVSVVLFVPRADGGLFLPLAWPALAAIPFGTFIFALLGWTVIPEMAVLLRYDARLTRLAVAIGSLGAAFLIWLFGVFAYAANGGATDLAPAAIMAALPHSWSWLIPAIGLLAMACSYVVITESLRAMFQHDAKWSIWSSRAIAVTLPFIILFFTSGNFIRIVDFIGSYISTLNALLICSIAWVVLRRVEHQREIWVLAAPWLCGAVFLAVLLERLIVR